jgi:outer membrane immunogenic protein
MWKVTGLLGAAVLFVNPALAGSSTSPHGAPVYSWTGCYVGADVGSAWDRQDVSIHSVNLNQAPVSSSLDGSHAIGGPYVGCNYEFAPGLVVGVEGDYSWTKLDGTASGPNLFANGTPVGAGGVLWNNSTDWVASVRGRFGYAVVPNMLVYGTGGVAWTRTSYAGRDTGGSGAVISTTFDQGHAGWVAGGGAEFAPWNNAWLLRLSPLPI